LRLGECVAFSQSPRHPPELPPLPLLLLLPTPLLLLSLLLLPPLLRLMLLPPPPPALLLARSPRRPGPLRLGEAAST